MAKKIENPVLTRVWVGTIPEKMLLDAEKARKLRSWNKKVSIEKMYEVFNRPNFEDIYNGK